jgi:succinate dehydrogenase/fumarate reductase cytochrome b subunit
LLALPFVLAMAGTAWVRITNLAILFVLLSLGLNIVVGFRRACLDLGYIAVLRRRGLRLRAACLAAFQSCISRGG